MNPASIPRSGVIAMLSLFSIVLAADRGYAQTVACGGLTCSNYATCEAGPACVCSSGYVSGLDALEYPGTNFTTCDDPNGITVTVSASATELAAALVGTGVTVSAATEAYLGSANASGTFTAGPLGMGAGVLLTTGDARLAAGPNEGAGLSAANSGGSSQRCLDIAPGYDFLDAAELSFTFNLESGFDGVCLDYLFGSEEYPEFAGNINDVGGVFLNGTNVGLDANSDPITINGPFFAGDQVETLSGTEYDGSTPRLRICQPLATGQHTLTIVVCDAVDEFLDSGIFVSQLAGYSGSPPGLSWCGDNNVDPGEECDDGNTSSDDGCTRECKISDPNCGNSTLDNGEGCDDGGRAPLDGCNDVCQVETGWLCSGEPSTCEKQAVEICSDDNECDDSDPCTVDACGSTVCEHAAVPDSDQDSVCDTVDGCVDDPLKVLPGMCGCGVAETNTDNDSLPDCTDQCPSDPNKIAEGACGCGNADTDSDSDTVADCNDLCPDDPNKIAPGACGCGYPDTDPGCLTEDLCPNDPDKSEPGVCGCDVADTDSDGDTVPDCMDQCADDADKVDPGVCGCDAADTDTDDDKVPDCMDQCADDADKVEPGECGCGEADTDSDGDEVLDCMDECPNDADKVEPGECGCGEADTDSDGDKVLDCMDECPNDAGKTESGACGCGEEDADEDGDDVPDCSDECPDNPNKAMADACGCDELVEIDGTCGDPNWRLQGGCNCTVPNGNRSHRDPLFALGLLLTMAARRRWSRRVSIRQVRRPD